MSDYLRIGSRHCFYACCSRNKEIRHSHANFTRVAHQSRFGPGYRDRHPASAHDRYGARMVWIATFVVLIAVVRYFADEDEAPRASFTRDRNSSTPVL